MEIQNQPVNITEGAELEQAADALAAMGMKTEKKLIPCQDLGKIFPLPSRQEPCGDPPKSDSTSKMESEPEKDQSNPLKQARCSACMKLIPNPISDGHGIVDGHVGQFRMLIPWIKEDDGNGVLCSRCYQRNWRLNKQRSGSDDQKTIEDVPREPYKCLCGMTFQSSQLKAAHCRLCQKYRDVADQEQRQEGINTTPKSSSKDCGQKRPRPTSELQGRSSPHPDTRKEHGEGLSTTSSPPPIKIQGLNSTPLNSFSSMRSTTTMATPLVKSSISSKGASSCSNNSSSTLNSQKLQLAQLLQTTRLLGQVDIVQYASLVDMVAATTDLEILSEVSQLVLQFALKPLVCPQQFIATPPTKMACFDAEGRPLSSLTLLPSLFKFPSEYEAHTLLQAMK